MKKILLMGVALIAISFTSMSAAQAEVDTDLFVTAPGGPSSEWSDSDYANAVSPMPTIGGPDMGILPIVEGPDMGIEPPSILYPLPDMGFNPVPEDPIMTIMPVIDGPDMGIEPPSILHPLPDMDFNPVPEDPIMTIMPVIDGPDMGIEPIEILNPRIVE